MAKETSSEKLQNNAFLNKFTEIAVKFGNLLYLRSLRDAFAVILPVFIIAGLGTMLNNTVFMWLFKGATLAKWQVFGNAITNGTLNVAGILVAPMIGYCLAKNMNFDNPIAAAAMSLASTFIVMPQSIPATTLAGKAVKVSGAYSTLWMAPRACLVGSSSAWLPRRSSLSLPASRSCKSTWVKMCRRRFRRHSAF